MRSSSKFPEQGQSQSPDLIDHDEDLGASPPIINDRSIAFRVGRILGVLAALIRREVEALIARCRQTSRQVRDNRRNDLLVESVQAILRRSEFSHSVKVHESQSHVLYYIQENEEEFYTEHWNAYNDLLKQALKAVGLTVLSLFAVAILAQAAFDDWRINDEAGKKDFPSTAWLSAIHGSLGSSGFWAIGLASGMLLLFCIMVAWAEISSRLTKAIRARYGIQEQLIPHVRVAINDWTDEVSPTKLRFEEAPGLGSVADARYLVERGEARRIRTLIRELGASAVAISGPRGAGKSTLLRSLAQNHSSSQDLYIGLEAPSSYQPREFVLTLYQSLCDCIAENALELVDSSARRITNRLITVARLAALLLAMLAVASQLPTINELVSVKLPDSVLPSNWWQVAAYSTFLLLLREFLEIVRPRRGWTGAAELVNRAQIEAQRLRFLQNVSVESSGTIKASFGFDLGRKRTRQLLEQAASMPELVRSYRSLASDTILWWRRHEGHGAGSLIVVIDELDRVTDVDGAERFINDVKGIFGIEHCTYLVTVSEDALAQFERRMVGIRPVLDSTFDEVIRLSILDITQSREILARRLVGFPQVFIALCHALSGGIPRDLIRTARSLIDARQTIGNDDLVPLAHEVIHQEIARFKSGMIGRINSANAETGSLALLRLLADPEWPERDVGGLLRAATDLLPEKEDTGPPNLISMQLGVALYYYATTIETFEAFGYRISDDASYAAEKLALTRSVMPTSVDLAYVHLQRLRVQVGFDEDVYGELE
ncbi:hypothetical protein O7631_30205 [Micromonospora sp. WMMD967]|uniref:hypothetical protein n=1 Tax=Micromonospora sp. WMMD967 TaxID=3016101 RepID=UPI0024169892|nr:hypothetical protein [Micromonospora sp. WMMD967]MDG4840821.1 hypothetical protein [Micromonospora sp. WMMD967]